MERERAPVVLADDDPVVLSCISTIAQLAGRSVAAGWSVPAAPWDLAALSIARIGRLAAPDDEEAAVTLALRGVAVIVGVGDRHRPSARWQDALTRVGSVHDWRGTGVAHLSLVQIHLLDALGNGVSMPHAARDVNVSVRTAHRRVAEARSSLGVATVAEAALALTVARLALVPVI